MEEPRDTGLPVPWAMQLVVRDDRPADPAERPTHLAVCEAAATAVVLVFADPRAQAEGPWHDQLTRWASGPIRKVVRRARNKAWDDTAVLDHVEADVAGVAVRAFVPGPVDDVPRPLAKLQVGGTQMPALGAPAAGVPGGVTIALTPHPPMTTGKAAAQSGHAAQLALAAMPPAARGAWRASGWAVRVTTPDAATWARLASSAPVAVRDGGFTEVAPGTMTALACWAADCQGDR